MREAELINNIDELINDIKSCIRAAGINNDSSEFEVVTEIFLYKFLNDKLRYELKNISTKLANAEDFDKALNELSEQEFNSLLRDLNADTAIIKRDQTISFLYQHKEYTDSEGNDFAWLLDKTLVDIANNNLGIFSVSTDDKNKIKLFNGVCRNIIDVVKRNNFAKAVISKLVNSYNFDQVFTEKYDFFSTIFEHLISEYNSNGGGANAEYYTPKSIAEIIGKILINEPVQNVEVCDPTAGSGTLLMAIAHEIGEDRCSIYSQDLTQKSVKLLRLNLILNNLTHSLPNVRQADILATPQFKDDSGRNLRQFDYIVSNPPFKTNFESTHQACLDDDHVRVINGKEQKRFFAGVPNIPAKDKEKMAIYLMVLQHILYSLKDDGKAGIVIPTKFLDWTDKIATTIRKYLIDNKYLRAVVSMPSNVFANTGTSVSVLFIDKSKVHEEVYMLDASNIGRSESIKINNKKVKKTILDEADMKFIIDSVNNYVVTEGKSVLKSISDIQDKHYSLCAGQYFDIKMKALDITPEEFNSRMDNYKAELITLFDKGDNLKQKVIESLEKCKYEG